MIHTGDCVEVMRTMLADSVDAVVTDPPYGLEFMGKEWDRLGNGFRRADNPNDVSRDNAFGRLSRKGPEYIAGHMAQAWHEQWATEAFRVLKPGGYLLAFGGTRTVHRLASAIEDAGFEIRDELVWIYASGFPKSLDVGKAMDRAAGAEREVVGENPNYRPNKDAHGNAIMRPMSPGEAEVRTAPATDLAKQWDGWGTALKPAHEPIVMARKPLIGTVAANVTRYGTGALNIDGSRIPSVTVEGAGLDVNTHLRPGVRRTSDENSTSYSVHKVEDEYRVPESGRWPSNVLLSSPELFDQPNPYVVGSGATASENKPGVFGVNRMEYESDAIYGNGKGIAEAGRGVFGYGDSGGYARFFKVPEYGRSGMLSACQTCGVLIAVPVSTTSPAPPNIAPPNAATPPSESSGLSASDAASPSLSPATDIAPRPAQMPLDGMQDSTASEDSAIPKPSTKRRSRNITLGLSPTTTSPPENDASSVARSDELTDTMTITRGPLMCASCVANATLESILPQPRPTGDELPLDYSAEYSRYLIVPKADRADREPTLRGQVPSGKVAGRNRADGRQWDIPGSTEANGKRDRENGHPTVKPTDLMRHLVRLVTPPGGTVLDCFLGSGSTAIACELEGFPWIGIERESEYVAIAEARLNGVQRGLGLDVPAPTRMAPMADKRDPNKLSKTWRRYEGFVPPTDEEPAA